MERVMEHRSIDSQFDSLFKSLFFEKAIASVIVRDKIILAANRQFEILFNLKRGSSIIGTSIQQYLANDFIELVAQFQKYNITQHEYNTVAKTSDGITLNLKIFLSKEFAKDHSIINMDLIKTVNDKIFKSAKERVYSEITLKEKQKNKKILQINEKLLDKIEQYKIQEEAINHLKIKLLQLNKVEIIGELTVGIVHDFKNMLTVIMGCAELIKIDIYPSNPKYQHVSEIIKACDNANSLTNQLLTFLRRQENEPVLVNVNHVITELLESFKYLLGRNINLDYLLGDKLPEVIIDPNHLKQILMNLVINSQEAMSQGGTIVITTSEIIDHKNNSQSFIQIHVNDSGEGMNETVRNQILNPFFTTKAKGTGIGLSIVQRLITLYSGNLFIESVPEQGTSVRIFIPTFKN